MKVFEIKSLNFSFGKRPILKDISFSLTKGTWLMIAGPNGAGKSTLVKILSGIWKKKNGQIIIWGKELENYKVKELSLKLSVLLSGFAPLYNINVLDYIHLGIYAKTGFMSYFAGKNMKDVQLAIETTEIGHLLKKGLFELSEGELQRVRIAKVLAQNSPIMVFDEPLAHLDIQHRIWALELFARLRAAGKTIISVIHDFTIAYPYPDSFLLLKQGKITYIGQKTDKKQALEAFSETFETKFYEKDGYLLPLRE